jgi:hypothetical protein
MRISERRSSTSSGGAADELGRLQRLAAISPLLREMKKAQDVITAI